MASKRLLIVAVLAVFAASPALLVVGDGKGWDLKADYDECLDGYNFIIGDTSVFESTESHYSVVQATTAGFIMSSFGLWVSGDDGFAHNASGQWWSFSGLGKDCNLELGIKFNITTLPAVKLSSSSLSPPLPRHAQGRGSVAVALAAAAVAVAGLFVLGVAFDSLEM